MSSSIYSALESTPPGWPWPGWLKIFANTVSGNSSELVLIHMLYFQDALTSRRKTLPWVDGLHHYIMLVWDDGKSLICFVTNVILDEILWWDDVFIFTIFAFCIEAIESSCLSMFMTEIWKWVWNRMSIFWTKCFIQSRFIFLRLCVSVHSVWNKMMGIRVKCRVSALIWIGLHQYRENYVEDEALLTHDAQSLRVQK